MATRRFAVYRKDAIEIGLHVNSKQLQDRGLNCNTGMGRMVATPVVFPHLSSGEQSLGLLTWMTPIVFKRGCFLLQSGPMAGSEASAPKAAVMML